MEVQGISEAGGDGVCAGSEINKGAGRKTQGARLRAQGSGRRTQGARRRAQGAGRRAHAGRRAKGAEDTGRRKENLLASFFIAQSSGP